LGGVFWGVFFGVLFFGVLGPWGQLGHWGLVGFWGFSMGGCCHLMIGF